MIERLLTLGGIISGVLAGFTQAYPGLLPGGEFYLGWTAVVLGLSSLVVPFVANHLKRMKLGVWANRVIQQAPVGQGVEINATYGDVWSQIVARHIEKELTEKGYQVLFQFKTHSIPFRDVRFSITPPKTVIDIGHLDSSISTGRGRSPI